MFLYYDRLSNMCTLVAGGEVDFLGPPKHALLLLQNHGLTDSQAREAVLQAVFNMGDAVDLSTIRKIAKDQKFSRNKFARSA